MQGDTAIVFDCGATNIRVIVIDARCSNIASESFPNTIRLDAFFPAYRIWDTDEIWEKMCLASQRVMKTIRPERITGITWKNIIRLARRGVHPS
jgi:L-fuculokinase